MKSTLELSLLYLLSAASTAAAAENASTAAATAIHWSPPHNATGATAVNQGYIGFGIEMKSFPDYAGLNSPNNFTAYLLALLSTRTGNAPLPIRIGGTSMDNSHFASTSPNATTPTGASCKLHTNVTIGAPWLRGFGHLPAGARYTLQVPLARKDVANGLAFAGAAVDAMGGAAAALDALEIGNEPNFYPTYGCNGGTDRAPGWGPVDYAREWRGYAGNLTRGVDGLGGGEWFQALGLSSSVDEGKWDFSKFWDQMAQGGHVKTVSQHYYQGDASGNLTYELMTHSVTVQKMENKFRHNIDFAHNHSGTPFVLGEVGSAIGGNGDPNPNLYGTLGAALWTLDFLLYGMTMGIHRVSMQLGTGFKIAAWQPINGKAVHGNFYGLAAGADFIGSAGNLKIQPLDLTGHPNVVGYAGYNGGELSKVAVLNLNFWNGEEESGKRGQRDINLTDLPDEVKRVRVSRLTGANATAEEGITWAGKRWTAENDGKEYQDGEKPVTLDVKNNSPVGNVTVKASEAILVEMLKN
ncbi:Glycoside hydrolase family 79 protein [Neofusicoccum parvum]|uniref:Glycoside hydrolase family 79 protein n=1 Tax=Neofusicoccum parvum TaxID=310453 RepID=A0ACB5RQJ7_9PEZI|nr:Glycoside hydrolase family 79 protein [Neofusicoccum parvum]